MVRSWVLWAAAVCVAAIAAQAHAAPGGVVAAVGDRAADSRDPLVVDLGYARYKGMTNSTAGINLWLGMRYGRNTAETRWQKPQEPPTNRSTVMPATEYGANCPSGSVSPAEPGYNFTGSEDCLFVSVVAPNNASNLPVLFYIHGGGYGQGSGNTDLTQLLAASRNAFVGVVIQYRLAGFGFLSSASVQKHGVPNAGLWDQQFALNWTQKYIDLFGGNPNHVTMAGESAGGGSVMLQTMANGGSLGTSLFRNAIAVSPYLPTQPNYNAAGITRNYLLFAQTAGCYSGSVNAQQADVDANGAIFKCLVDKDSYTLQNASSYVSSSVLFDQWAFIPVTDGNFLQELPTQQLGGGKVNGRNILATNNADEGVGFVPQNVTTEADFQAFVHTIYPGLSDQDVAAVLKNYPSTSAPVNPAALNYSTAGNSGATALNQSIFGTGQQQRANNFYAETTFVCPSYYLSDAFAQGPGDSYHYQYSVIGASHATDLPSYFGPLSQNYSPEFMAVIMSIWSHFITTDNPSVPQSPVSVLHDFPTWSRSPAEKMIDVNETGGVPYATFGPQNIPIIQFEEPGIQLAFRKVNAYSWEGGRGKRCNFLRQLGPKIPM